MTKEEHKRITKEEVNELIKKINQDLGRDDIVKLGKYTAIIERRPNREIEGPER